MNLLVDLKKEWRDAYLDEYDYLLALFKNAVSGQRCNCRVYSSGSYNVPPYQDDLEIVGHGKGEDDGLVHTEVVLVRCRTCKREWVVDIGYSYHYPHSHWRQRE